MAHSTRANSGGLNEATQQFLSAQVEQKMNAVVEVLSVRLQAMVDAAMRNNNRTLETNRNAGEGTSKNAPSSQFTRMTKIDFPKIRSDDVRGWLQYIRAMGENVPWDNYRVVILKRFGNAFDDPLAEFKNVRHVTTIEDYQNSFDKLISRVDLLVDQLVNFYIAGLQIVVELARETVTLRGTQKTTLQWIQGKKIVQPTSELSSMMLCVYPVAELFMINVQGVAQAPIITHLLDEYADVFVVPTSLAPERSYDHKIVLKERSMPVNVRPYRHPPNQKDAIENMVKELLESRVIRESQSSFASPVVLSLLRHHTLFTKHSKCVFAADKVEYLGHIITKQGVETDPSKTESMKLWPVPKTIKQLRGFLGLTGYYKRFIRVDALSRVPTSSQLMQMVLTIATTDLLPKIVNSWKNDTVLQAIITKLQKGENSDGQTEVVNRCLETYLRCMTGEKPKEWSKWLSLAEYWYNTNFHTTIQTTPYEVIYGQPPPNPIAYVQGQSIMDQVDRSLSAREAMV
nr:putative mitochondrial protein [Tanacetum cinerariifolium]